MQQEDSWDIRLLTATYKRGEGDTITVELYGKTRDGRSAVVRYSGFRPYFQILGDVEKARRILSRRDDVIDITPKEFLHRGEKVSGAVVTVKFPWTVPEFRNLLKGTVEVFAADIPFAHRFIYDMDIASCCRVSGRRAEEGVESRYRCDIVIEAERFAETQDFIPDLRILSFDIETSIKNKNIWCICLAYRQNNAIVTEKIADNSEARMLELFFDAIARIDPDVITGYNIDGFDIPTIDSRADENHLARKAWGRDGEDVRQVSNRFWRCNGRIIADAWWHMKKQFHPKQETLNAVAKELLNEEKLDVNRLRIDEEWKENRERVLDYCAKDAELALRILEKTHVLTKGMDMATVSKLPLDDSLNSGASQLVDSLLIRAADREGIATPMTSRYLDSEEDRIEGGYVHSIAPGLYHWVGVLDFKSMYPSLIIAKNICFTTLSSRGDIVSPTGVRFLSPSVRKGVIPSLLSSLMEQRDSIKARMKQSSDPAEVEYLDGLQQAVKILMNSFYGVLASSFYRFTNISIGGSITAFARETTKGVIEQLEKDGISVIYSDTDSVFFKSPVENLEGTIEFGQRISERFSRQGATLEFEEVIEPLFSHGKKKRYVGRQIWPEEGLIVRGYEIRRTDSFDYQSESLSAVFEEILKGNTSDAVKLSKKLVTDVLNGLVPKEKLVISRTCRPFSEYKDENTQVPVQAAKKLMAMGEEFIPGMKVSWIVVNSRKTPQHVEPYIVGREFEFTPDYAYYASRVAQTLSRVTEVFGMDEESLLSGSRQSTLFDEVKVEKAISGKRTASGVRLEDFF
ncbi:MAG: ribonuclease H-like domain-containing protein [Thermoplasmata archaeon YP2-bin.285]|uniref:DNA-directed DNA polymerase n=2 Tax=Candidatus Sysuiplasma superficiale TaxID=2823368 RepID=A0A8J8CET2_9ARCH|nr:ribonuclease H-like domain-containing protein [Candidatus Sysuiplasma superficiale]